MLFLSSACHDSSGGDKDVYVKVHAPASISTGVAPVVVATPPGLSLHDSHVTATWTVTNGPGQITHVQDGNRFQLFFPFVGTYEINLLVEGRRRRGGDTFIIQVGGTGFTINGNVNDNGLAKSGVDVDLRWLSSGQILASTSSNATGDFQFTGLAGTIEDYQVDVQGGP